MLPQNVPARISSSTPAGVEESVSVEAASGHFFLRWFFLSAGPRSGGDRGEFSVLGRALETGVRVT
jgi:hypothetical protein